MCYSIQCSKEPLIFKSSKKVVDFGKGYETLRITWLRRSKETVTGRLASIKESWKDTGCTILTDGWSDMCHRPLINVLVSCPRGVLFLRVFIDVIGQKKTSEYVFKILDEAIIEVEEGNVVQFVNNNATKCGRLKLDRENIQKSLLDSLCCSLP
jgi:hypothetical protein